MPPSVVWNLGGTTLTFSRGIIRGAINFQSNRIVEERLAGGEIVTYELSGMTDREVIDCTFPHLTKAQADAAVTFKNTTIKDNLLSFTHTDNSESPALVKTVRLMPESFRLQPEHYTDPAAPRFTLAVELAVEPS